jgi:CheY-like chemotaxis protein
MPTILVIADPPGLALLPPGSTLVRLANVPAALGWLAANGAVAGVAVLAPVALPGLGLAALARAGRALPGRAAMPVVAVGGEAPAGCVAWDPGQGPETLAALLAGQAAVPAETPAPASPQAVALNALVVDDNSTNRMVAQGLLVRLGCRVTLANDGIEGVQAALAERFDIVFMDVQMPRMDGITATRAIRGNEARLGLARIPIVALTALSQTEDRARCLEAGMDAHLAKPVSQQSLAGAIQRFCPRFAPSLPSPPQVRAAIQAADEAAELDPEVAGRLRELGADLASELWLEYANELPGRCAEIAAAGLRGDDGAAQRLVHGLKGSAGTLGLSRLHHHLEALDRAIRRREAGWQERCAALAGDAAPAGDAARRAAQGG